MGIDIVPSFLPTLPKPANAFVTVACAIALEMVANEGLLSGSA